MPEKCCSISETHENSSEKTCPECGKEGKLVQRITLGSLLKPAARKRMPPGDTFLFCASPDCPRVYFREGTKPFHIEDLSVRVGQKVKEGEKPVCYCFGYTEQMIIDDVQKNGGKTNIPEEIKAQVKAGNCFCEITNPQGSCCLGNVSQAVKKGMAIYPS